MRRRVLNRFALVMILVIVVGGSGVAVYADLSGAVGGLSSGATSASSTAGYGFGAGAALSGFSIPHTQLIGGQGFSTETATPTITEMSTSSATINYPQSTVGGLSSSTYSSDTNASGHSIEFFGTVSLQVSGPASSLQQASQVAYGLGGYVGATSYDASTNGSATITLLIPAQSFQTAILQLEGLGKVMNLQSGSNDVTVQYADLNATLVSLKTEQDSLLKLLNQSSNINSTIQIESIIQQTDAQINSVESQVLETAQLVNYASISVTFETAPSIAVPAPIVIKLSATPNDGLNPMSVTFDAIVKGGVAPYVVNYNFADGTSTQGQQLIHEFTQTGSYNVTVSATDQTGNVSLSSVMITVKSPPVQSGLSAFAGSVWGIFSSVIEGIVEVAAVVLPVGLVAYFVSVPALRYYRSRTDRLAHEEKGESADASKQ